MLRRRGLVVLSISVLTGCGGDDSSDGSGGTSTGGNPGGGAGGASGAGGSAGSAAGAGGSSGGSGGGSSAPKPSPGCNGGSITPGDSTVAITHDGKAREYRLHVPPSYDGSKPLPLVLNFHGYSSNASQQQLFSAMNGKADSAGFILIYPQGLPNPGTGQLSFNGGSCCAFGDLSRDDVGFASAMLDDIFAKGCVDERRVYSTGMSNGGAMSHRLACELSDRIAAVAPVAHILGIPFDTCKPARPVSIVHLHGTTDQLVPYDGGGSSGYPSVPETFAAWGARHGCTGAPKETLKAGASRCETYESCKEGAEVTLCTLEGMGHCWPGQPFCLPGALGGTANTEINANDRMWETFQKFALP